MQQAPYNDPWGGKLPWEFPGFCRRDCLPHRSGKLLWVSRATLVMGMFSVFGVAFTLSWLGFLGVLGLILGGLTWGLVRFDLAQMANGTVDPRGRPYAEEALGSALTGMVLSLPSTFLVLHEYRSLLLVLRPWW
jgi:hypothetical protein